VEEAQEHQQEEGQEYRPRGYEGLLPPQEQYLNRLMSVPTSQWPQSLLDFVRSQHLTSFDTLTDTVGRWVKEQRD
jgi:hypothetical protein